MFHKKCIKSYLSQFKRDVQILLGAGKDEDNDLSSDNGLQRILSIRLDNMPSLKLETRGYPVTDVPRNMLCTLHESWREK